MKAIGKKKPIIGMLHLPALPGSPGYQGNWKRVVSFALEDAKSLHEGGVDALMLENYWDLPFYPDEVPQETVAHMAMIARCVRSEYQLPLGINVLRNDGVSALSIAQAVGADFIRINILTGARLTDQGIIEGKAHQLLRHRKRIGAEKVKIFADIAVKYSTPLTERTLKAEVEETLHRSGSDGLIVSGEATGKAVDLEVLQTVKELSKDTPVLVGSGVSLENIEVLFPWADGFIVGSSFKPDLESPIEKAKVKKFIDAMKRMRS